MVFCLLLSFEGFSQHCKGGSYGEKPPASGIDLALRASMDLHNDLNSVIVRNQGIVDESNTIGTPYK